VHPLIDRLRSVVDRGHPRYRSVLRNREGGRTIVFLIGLLLAVAAVLFVVGRIDTARRSGTIAAVILSSRLQPGSAGMRETPQGSQIEYQYTVNGTTYAGADFRPWVNIAAHDPKVCFEPADPANHLLVEGRIRCGIDAGP
jgi:hypothetical protein